MYNNRNVYLLDLCTFSYQLHSQTLIWPMDPYYEQWSESSSRSRRERFMQQVHSVSTPANYPNYRGPAKLMGKPSNTNLDPIISDYSQINPWRPSVVRANKEEEGWILYNTSKEITDRISMA